MPLTCIDKILLFDFFFFFGELLFFLFYLRRFIRNWHTFSSYKRSIDGEKDLLVQMWCETARINWLLNQLISYKCYGAYFLCRFRPPIYCLQTVQSWLFFHLSVSNVGSSCRSDLFVFFVYTCIGCRKQLLCHRCIKEVFGCAIYSQSISFNQ
jgi:hypothetical protein